jgi:hypothetical protein
MRILLPGLAVVLMTACTPPAPPQPSGGVGFGDYSEYQRRRAAEAEALIAAQRSASLQSIPGPVRNPAVPFPSTGTGAPTAAELAQAGVSGAASLAQTQQAYPQPAYPESVANQPALVSTPTASSSNVGISDEQDFSAVSSRETIASDKERIAQNRAQYQQIQPGALPTRTGDNAARIIEYAVKAPNRLGESIYKRSSLALTNHDRACARYANPEEAQEAFLNSGGPQKDPKNLDPDGDGFACRWDPTPFQAARG